MDASQRKALTALLWTWYRAATSDLLSDPGLLNLEVFSNWESGNRDYFHRYTSQKLRWGVSGLIRSLELEAWQPVETWLREDPETGEIFEKLIRVGNTGRALRPIDLAQYLLVLPDNLQVGAPFDFEDARLPFEEAVSNVCAFFETREFQIETLVLLQGIESNVDYGLSPELEFICLSNEQIRELLNSGTLGAQALGQDSYFVSLGPRVALRHLERARMRIGDRELNESFNAASSVESERFLNCIALSASNRVSDLVSTSITRGPMNSFWGSSRSPSKPQSIESERLAITATLWNDIADCWGALISTKPSNTVSLAIRRLRQANVRGDIHDRLIDLMIAAEAIFLEDVAGELSFRLAVRAACWLEDNGPARRVVFDTFRKAYDARSAIAHGGDQDQLKKVLKGQALGELVESVENIMRRSLRKAVMEHQGSMPKADYWSQVLFDEKQTPEHGVKPTTTWMLKILCHFLSAFRKTVGN